jgi:hypothetical protein
VPLYLVLLPLFPALKIASFNITRLDPSHFLLPAVTLLAGVLLLRGVLRLFIANGELLDRLLALGFVCLFAAGYILPSSLYAIGWIAVFAGLAYLTIREAAPRKNSAFGLAVVAVALLAMPVVRMVVNAPVWFERASVSEIARNAFPELPGPSGPGDGERRDVYYIILDRYARADQLLEVYGYDNSSFLNALNARGFSISDQSYSNYQRTAHSLASSLNMAYLDGLEVAPAATSHDWVPLYDLLQDFRLLRFFDGEGYATHFLGSWWEPTRRNLLVDESYTWRAWPEMARIIVENSLVGQAAELIGVEALDSRWLQCQRPRHKFERLMAISERQEATFAFAHFLVPHPPFVLDEQGTCMSVAEASARTRAENYIGQLRYANDQLLQLVDHLMSRPGPEPIIVLQADEGPWPEVYAGDEITRLGTDVSAVDWLATEPAELREKMAILNALYLPGVETGTIASDATPVNSFRLILRHYFGVPLEDLPDRQLVYESALKIYSFHDVSEKLDLP